MADDVFNKFLIDFSNYDCFDECTDSETDREKIEKLRSTREQVNWSVEAERHRFYWKFCSLIRDWRGQLPDLQEIFRREEIDWLLAKCAETGPIDFIDFVTRTGYRDEPDDDRLDDEAGGESRWRRVTAVHEAARHRHGDWVAMVRELFKVYGRFDVDYTDAQSSGLGHFHVACAAGCADVAKKFIELGRSRPNRLVPGTGDSPLHLALREMRRKVVKLLLRRGADPSLANARGVTPLHAVSDKRYGAGWANLLFEICDAVRAEVRLDAPDEYGYMPLHRALRYGNTKLVELLLRRGAEPNAANATARVTPLHVISDRRYDADCATAFFELCREFRLTIRVDARDRSGRAPLHWAAHHGNTRFAELLLRRGADPDVADKDGCTPLHFIVDRQVDDDDDATEIFLRMAVEVDRPVEVDVQNYEDETPLHLALRRGNDKAAEALLRAGADANLCDEKGLSPLHSIVSRTTDDHRSLEKFLGICAQVRRAVQVDARDKTGRTPLHLALTSGNKRTVEALLRAGADPNSADREGLTSLHIVGRARQLDVGAIETLFELCSEKCKPVLVDARDKSGDTPLHLALRRGNDKAAESLLRRGADPRLGTAYNMVDGSTCLHIVCARDGVVDSDDAVETFARIIDETRRTTTVPIDALDELGRTPLHVALSRGKTKAAEALLRRGADPNSADRAGRCTPLHCICQRRFNGDLAETFLRMADRVGRPVEVDARNREGETALHLALRHGNTRAAEALLRAGADPNSCDEKGLSPLHLIVSRTITDDDRSVKKFFEICADLRRLVQVDARDKTGRTPLHLALTHDRKRIVASLLRAGADPNSTDQEGSTPLHVICQRYRPGDGDLIKVFFEISDDGRRPVKVDARDKFGRTPLQWAVANVLPDTVDFLLDKAGAADLSAFVFPTEDYFCKRFDRYQGDWNKLRLASGVLVVVERLVEGGYELVRSDAREIMKLFKKYGLLEKSSSTDLEKCLRNDHGMFARAAEGITIVAGLSLRDLIRSRAEKLLTYADYLEFAITEKLGLLGAKHKEACTVHLCEKLSSKFFRSWTVYPFWELIHRRLPLECCEMIVEEIKNEDLFAICQAVEMPAKQSRA